MSLTVKPAIEAGAYIRGIDLNSVSTADVEQIKDALGNYGVVFFRDQSISSKNHIALAELFGAININRFFTPLTDYPQIAQVLKEPEHDQNIGENWHTDHSYDQIPALGSILVARKLPSSGGDTLFVNMFAAYDALCAEMKHKLDDLRPRTRAGMYLVRWRGKIKMVRIKRAVLKIAMQLRRMRFTLL